MRFGLGDILEWFAAGFLIAAAATGLGVWCALLVAGVALAYFAQCYDGPLPAISLHMPQLRRKRPPPAPLGAPGEPQPTIFHCALCDEEVLQGEPHICPEV